MKDDVKLAELRNEHGYFGPYPTLNTALNASEASSLDRQDRKAESFTFSPLYCGFDFSMTRASADAALSDPEVQEALRLATPLPKKEPAAAAV